MNNSIPWKRIDDFLLEVGNIRTPKELCVQAIKNLYPLIPYDQARIYFIDKNTKVYDDVLFGVGEGWSDLYLEYYSKIENGRYSISNQVKSEYFSKPSLDGRVYNWENYDHDEFILNYIIPQGIKYSMGIGFHSADNTTTTVCSLDRTGMFGYTLEELNIKNIIQHHVDNLHKNLFAYLFANSHNKTEDKLIKLLTKRELEISHLLCDGVKPRNIGQRLQISLPTVYRHIANIYQKLNVSSQQELIVKLLHFQEVMFQS